MNGVHGPIDRCDYANGKTGFQPDGDRLILVLRHETADVAGDRVADGAIERRQQLKASDTRASGRFVIDARPDAKPIGDRLPGRAQHAKSDAERGAEQDRTPPKAKPHRGSRSWPYPARIPAGGSWREAREYSQARVMPCASPLARPKTGPRARP